MTNKCFIYCWLKPRRNATMNGHKVTEMMPWFREGLSSSVVLELASNEFAYRPGFDELLEGQPSSSELLDHQPQHTDLLKNQPTRADLLRNISFSTFT